VGSAGSDHNMVNQARQILKKRLQGSRIVGIEGRGALGAEFARRLFETFAIASSEDDAGALGAGTSSGFKAYARTSRPRGPLEPDSPAVNIAASL
jgi:hypothetical protein